MGNCKIEKLGKNKSTFDCLLQFDIHTLNLLHLGLGECCQNRIITLAHRSKKSSKVDHKPKLHSSRKPIIQETETINNK